MLAYTQHVQHMNKQEMHETHMCKHTYINNHVHTHTYTHFQKLNSVAGVAGIKNIDVWMQRTIIQCTLFGGRKNKLNILQRNAVDDYV